MDSNTLDFQGRSKQKWTLIEDLKLVEALVEYHREREGNLKNKFKPGYLKDLEEKSSTKFPSAGLKVKSDIESRLRTLKRLRILPLFNPSFFNLVVARSETHRYLLAAQPSLSSSILTSGVEIS
nr:hypothetical protein CFP56_45151 [Quercus suber]